MKFEGRDLGRAVEHVPASELKLESVYFVVRYHDHDLSIPELSPLVFIGRDLADDDQGFLYFQDYASFSDGERFGSGPADGGAVFERFIEAQGSSVCHYESAVDELLRCLLRRQGRR